MGRIGTDTALDIPFFDSCALPNTFKIAEKKSKLIVKIAKDTTSSTYYVDILDFLVGEVLGLKFRKLCEDYYHNNGKKMEDIFNSDDLKKLDSILSNVLNFTFELCKSKSSFDLLDFMRDTAGSQNSYKTTDSHRK
ncbi:MAG: hypothetical protein AAGU21_15475 [Solidesulfovibrio sp.]|uniref:hypothetical protein n=1 Tax=Solidesulfovibrio sp. TaxID=2910990 RepID=UPI0031598FEB